MKFLQIIMVYLLSSGFCIALDIVWLKIMKNFYFEHLTHLAKATSNGSITVNIPFAVCVWLILTLGIAFFVITPLPSLPTFYDALRGALFGLLVYSIYNLTNAATLKDWSLMMVFVDSAWAQSYALQQHSL